MKDYYWWLSHLIISVFGHVTFEMRDKRRSCIGLGDSHYTRFGNKQCVVISHSLSTIRNQPGPSCIETSVSRCCPIRMGLQKSLLAEVVLEKRGSARIGEMRASAELIGAMKSRVNEVTNYVHRSGSECLLAPSDGH